MNVTETQIQYITFLAITTITELCNLKNKFNGKKVPNIIKDKHAYKHTCWKSFSASLNLPIARYAAPRL